jgi:hypothetical protein
MDNDKHPLEDLIKEVIKENLSISIEKDEYMGCVDLDIKIWFKDEEISSSNASISGRDLNYND